MKNLTRTVMCLTLSVAFTGCETTPSPSAPASSKTDATAETTAARESSPDDTKQPDEISADRRDAYREHLKAGREAFDAKEYDDAVLAFEKALEAIPMDGRALSELGWAAFQAADYDKARAANEDAVRVTSEPNLKAASLYNLGRIAEAQNNVEAAKAFYTESLLLRPNDVVEARLDTLGTKVRSPVAGPTLPDFCRKPEPSIDDICACFDKAHSDDFVPGGPPPDETCGLAKEDSPTDVNILKVASGMLEWDYYLIYRTSDGWKPIASLGHFWEGGIGGVLNDPFTFEFVDRRATDGREILRIDISSSGADIDAGVNEVSTFEKTETALCVLDGTPRCPILVPTSYSYSRTAMADETEDSNDEWKELRTKALPIKESYSLQVKLNEDATTVTIEAQPGSDDLPSRVEAMLGEHSL